MKISIFLFLFLLAGEIAPAQTNKASTIAFVNVNVIPMDHERVLRNQTVIVRNGIISDIGDAGKVKVAKDAVRIDGSGKFLIPGLTDMHVHLMSDEDEFPESLALDEFRVMLANGVTTIRLMTGTPEQLVWRAKSASGEILARAEENKHREFQFWAEQTVSL